MDLFSYNIFHDSSLCLYSRENDEFINLDLEKILEDKHCKGILHKGINGDHNYLIDICKYLDSLGVDRKRYTYCAHSSKQAQTCESVHRKSSRFLSDSNIQLKVKIVERFLKSTKESVRKCFPFKRESWTHHHLSHAACGYYQSPFEKAFIITHDGSGDGYSGCTFLCDGTDNYKITKHRVLKRESGKHWNLGKIYQQLGVRLPMFKPSDRQINLDVPGKMMGLSAYGKEGSKWYKIAYDTMYDGDITTKNIRVPNDDFQKQADFCLGVQRAYEDVMVGVIEKWIDTIAEYDNNVVISGGCGLNILINGVLQDRFPHLNIFVPPNTTDDGLSLGGVFNTLSRNKWRDMKPENRKDFTYGGIRWISKKPFEEYGGKETTKEEIAKMLKSGSIIGVVQGNHELGKRALGNRSIICDASFPDMKDKINVIKNREHYRPFAPMCRREDAEKYFDASNYNFLSHMNIAVRTKEEYKEQLSSITHVDGTARLQTVTREQNELMYDLLTLIDGVFLNTSFNVAGKPILNTLESAFYILEETALDAVVVRNNGKYYLFT